VDIEQKSTMSTAAPVMTKAKFSEISGLGEDIIRGMIERGHLPTVKIGKHRLVNTALLTSECLNQEFESF
jgi:hypothetical protein